MEVVYVIESAGRYKIGTTKNLDERLKSLATMNSAPAALVGTIDGGRAREAALHREFAQYRTHGEWFRLPPAALETLKARLAGEPRVIQLPTATKRMMTPHKRRRRRPSQQQRKRSA